MPPINRTILIADDDFDDVELLEEAFAEIEPGLEILVANSGKKAIEILKRCPSDRLPILIVLDFNMPDLSGAEVLELIGENDRYADIPKIIWSTADFRLYEKICKSRGANYYFKKPHSFPDILETVRKMLRIANNDTREGGKSSSA